MKKRILALCFMLCAVLSVAGCASGPQKVQESEEQLKIVCTIFPEYDWIKQILGARAQEVRLTLLMKDGADLHSYQPTMWDIRAIAEADLFLYVGGESDAWVEDVLANTGNPHRKVLNLMELLKDSVKEEEHLEGMREDQEHDQEEEEEYDEHVWLSLRNAEKVCSAFTETLCELDEANRQLYQYNENQYQERLKALDQAYEETVRKAENPVLLFGDRFAFRYLAEDYGITCFAAFPGCSAETEAGFSTITFLAEKAGACALPVILAMDGSDQKIARTIAGNTDTRDQKVRVLDSMQSVSSEAIRAGESYLSIMERNLEVLKEALNVQGGV